MGDNTTAVITNTYSRGVPTGTKTSGAIGGAGGLAGTGGTGGTNGSLGSSGSSGSVAYVGGLVGNPLSGSYSSSYWDTTTSGYVAGDGVGNGVDPAGITGKTTTEMQQQSTFTGWDFITPIWSMIEASTSPYLNFQTISDAPTNVVAIA